MMKKVKIIFVIICCITYTVEVFAFYTPLADPDLVATGYAYDGAPSAKVGNYFQIQNFYFGGFLEARNERRFEQAALPNHNWRGFAFFDYEYSLYSGTAGLISLYAGYEHESAHSTMGFYERNDEAYEMIYDNYYRNINLNSLLVRFAHSVGESRRLTYSIDYQFYFLGRNTPELHNHDLTQGHGLSIAIQYAIPVYKTTSLYIAIFDRYIFQSAERRMGYIYYDVNNGVEQRYESYPIINNVNTITAKCGLLFNDLVAGRKLNLYAKVLYGNIFGFVDSREQRLVLAAGIEIVQ